MTASLVGQASWPVQRSMDFGLCMTGREAGPTGARNAS